MKWVSFVWVALLATVCLGQATTTATTPLGVEYAKGRGFQIMAGGVPITRGSGVQLYAPGWKEGYYSSSGGVGTSSNQYSAQNEWLVEHHAPQVDFNGAETVRRVDGTHIEWTLGGTLKSDKPARVEWALGQVNAFPMYGGSYAAPPGAKTPVVPEATRAGDAAPVIAGAKQIDLETGVGRLTFKVEEGAIELALLDGRRMPGRSWTQEQPTFWLGVLGAEITANEPFKFRVSVAFTPAPEATAAQGAKEATAPAVPTDRAFAAQPEPVRVIPRPKSMVMGEGRFVLTPETKLVVVTQSGVAAARSLANEAEERLGWAWRMYATESADPTGHTILFQRPNPARNWRPEEYAIDCGPKGLVVTAGDNAGYFYAAQTLAQLFQAEGNTVYFPACRIDDYPSLAFRGVHLFTGKDAMPLHRRLLERVIARYKMNHLVMQVDYTQWNTDPKLTTDFSVPKEQVAEYVKLVRQNTLEPIPLVQSLGHAEWMFKNGRNVELAEDPEVPYAYSVTNPATYAFIQLIYDETLALFGSRYFHIGHDEVSMRGRYPFREEARRWGKTKLFVYDTNRLHDYLADKGVRTMMWGDMLLSRDESNDSAANAPSADEAARRRAEISKDIVICDWHYTPSPPEDYKSLKVFRDAGFTTIACTWDNPENIYTFAQAARLYGAWGLLQTTWAGYSITARTVAEQPQQFAAYVLAAEYAWSANSPRPAELGWNAQEVFDRAMQPARMELGVRPGWMLNLSGVPGVEDLRDNFLGFGSALDLVAIRGDDRISNHLFWSGDGSYPAVVLGGALLKGDEARPRAVTLKCDLPAGATEVAFLQATAFPARAGDVVGEYELVYADGTTSATPLKYGQETRALTDTRGTHAAETAWSGRTAAGVPAALRMLRVTNPEPGKTIKAIRFSTDHPYASPILFGVTAVR